MDSNFSLSRGKAEKSGERLPLPRGQAGLADEHHRTEHYAFIEERTKAKDVARQAYEALRTAHINASPKQVFEAVGGFTVDLDDQEAEQLQQLTCIKSCEADQPLELTNSVESVNAGELVQPATGLKTRNKTAFKGRVIDGSQEEVKAQQDVEVGVLRSYGDSTAASGEILPYGVKKLGWSRRFH